MKIEKVIVLLLLITMIFTTIAVAYADDEHLDTYTSSTLAEDVASCIDRIIGSEVLVNNFQRNKDNYYVDSPSFNVNIPIDGNAFIGMFGGDDIMMGLPEEFFYSKGFLTNSGAMVYDTNNQDVCVVVQVVVDQMKNDYVTGVREIVMLKNEKAPQEYRFPFDLPDGYFLIEDYDYNDEDDEFDCGAIYIVNNNGEAVSVIDPAWAKDSYGNDVESFYTIDGNTLVQTINYSDKNVFPIIADPTNHPNIPHYEYYTKNQIKELRSECSTLSENAFVSLLITLGGYIPFVGPVISGMFNSINIGNATYKIRKYFVWNKIYNEFTKTYAKVNFPEKWNAGHRCYHSATVARFVSYTYSKT